MSWTDRLKEAMDALVRERTAHTDHHALYPCKVVAQKADGSLDLKPDKASIAAPTGVKFRSLPGVSVKVQPGARVLLGYEGGDPSRPFASLSEDTSLVELMISASVKVTVSAPLVLLGDGLRQPVCVGDVITGLISAAPGAPVTGVIASALGTPVSKVKV